jgi:hypothetical protein
VFTYNKCYYFFQAIRYYRQAIQLLPDIESRLSDFNELVPKNGENLNGETSSIDMDASVIQIHQ